MTNDLEELKARLVGWRAKLSNIVRGYTGWLDQTEARHLLPLLDEASAAITAQAQEIERLTKERDEWSRVAQARNAALEEAEAEIKKHERNAPVMVAEMLDHARLVVGSALLVFPSAPPKERSQETDGP